MANKAIYTQKPVKWGVKLWYLDYSNFKYIWDFFVYQDTLNLKPTTPKGRKDKMQKRGNVVKKLVVSLHIWGHIVVMDNFFTATNLFVDMVEKCTYVTGTIRSNRSGISIALQNKTKN